MSKYPDVKLFIAGEWRDGQEGKTLPIIDPATEEEIGRLAHATKPDLDAALEAAERGFKVWRDTSAFERYKILRKAADILRERKDDIGWLMTREQGKPLNQSSLEVAAAADTIDWIAEEGRRTYGRVIPARGTGVTNMTLKLPVGPVAAFTPWNFPINQIVRKLCSALATGCSIIVKAPEETPASPAELIRAFTDAGVPTDVMNLVYGVPAEISEYLIPHPTIRKISFTGSTPVGKHLAALAGQHMKRATMELGGHAPVLVFDDADVDKAVKQMAVFKTRNAGQVCISPTRFLVQDRVHDKFLDGFIGAMEKMKVGNGLEADTDMGPLANERRIPAIEDMINDATSKGGNLATGGERVGNKGYFFQPTVLSGMTPEMQMFGEETFGPVSGLFRFSSDEEAIAMANDTEFGLAAYIFTNNTTRLFRVSEALEYGMVSANTGIFSSEVGPFGGVKSSGLGREGSKYGIDEFLEIKFVCVGL